MRLGLGIGLGRLQRSSIDPAAAAYFAATGITGATEKAAINTLVSSLKSAGLWSKMKAVYPFVTDNRNLLSYTEDFGNAYWGKYNTTVTTNSINAPNGTLTADTITTTTGGYISVALNNNGLVQTYSVYVKKKTDSIAYCGIYDIADKGFWFSFDTGLVTQTTSGVSNATMTSVGDGWYRVSFTFTNQAGTTYLASPTPRIASGSATRGTDLYIWGIQLDSGSTLTTYQPIATTQQSYISNQFKYNLVNPVDSDSAFRGVFNGGWTFSNQGATPNGTNGYMDTKFVPSTNGLTLSNAHISFYSRSTSVNGSFPVDLGVDQTGTGLNVSQKMGDPGQASYHGRGYAQLITGVDSNNIAGLHTITRTSTTSLKYNRNGSLIQTNTVLETGPVPTVSLFVGATNNNGTANIFSNRQSAFASIGDGLTDTEATALYNAVQTFNQSLNRAI